MSAPKRWRRSGNEGNRLFCAVALRGGIVCALPFGCGAVARAFLRGFGLLAREAWEGKVGGCVVAVVGCGRCLTWPDLSTFVLSPLFV